MKLTVRSLVVAMVVGGALGAVGNHHLLAQQKSVTRTVLLKTDLVGISGYELQMVRRDFAPGEIGAKHPHPGTECFYVIEGAAVLDKEGQPPADIKAGEAHCIPPGTVMAPRNASTSDPYKVLLITIYPKGRPATKAVK
jgi:quercetin dioxygenase-like cupin family protein